MSDDKGLHKYPKKKKKKKVSDYKGKFGIGLEKQWDKIGVIQSLKCTD